MRLSLKSLSACGAVCMTLLAACANESNTPTSTPPTPTTTVAPAGVSTLRIPTPAVTRHPVPVGTPTLDPPRQTPETGVVTTTYTVRRGDTLNGIATITGVSADELQRLNGLRNPDAIQAGQQLLILRQIQSRAPSIKLIPDSELVNGPTAAEFDAAKFVAQKRGYLSRYTEDVAGDTLTGAQIVQRVAEQFSVHPRLLLAALEYMGGWVTRAQPDENQLRYPLGYKRTNVEGLNVQLNWAALRLNEGYYGWRLGTRTYARLDDGTYGFLGDGINAGTAAVQNYLAAVSTQPAWAGTMSDQNSENGDNRAFMTTYRRLFGNPWQYDFGPLVPEGLRQPPLELPWRKGETWYLTGGPHSTWGAGTPWGALDLTSVNVSGCDELPDWVTAMANGVIARSVRGEVSQSLDPSGDDRIGWSLLYLHVGSTDRVKAGVKVKGGDRIGHPSCEGGLVTGAHVHLARRYNGEWINADGATPFNLSGWVASESDSEYDGLLIKGNERREPCECKLPAKNGIAAPSP